MNLPARFGNLRGRTQRSLKETPTSFSESFSKRPDKSIDLYCSSFNKIQNTKVNCENDITKFTNILIDIKNNHDHLEDSISKGLLLLNKEVDSSLINYDLINKELDKFFLSRISPKQANWVQTCFKLNCSRSAKS